METEEIAGKTLRKNCRKHRKRLEQIKLEMEERQSFAKAREHKEIAERKLLGNLEKMHHKFSQTSIKWRTAKLRRAWNIEASIFKELRFPCSTESRVR